MLLRLLETEALRVEKNAELEASKHAVEMERYKLELANIEQLGVEKRKQQLFNENLKESRRERLQKARAAKAAKAAAAAAAPATPQAFDCEECAAISENRAPRHSSHLIMHKTQNHSARWAN